MSGNLPDLPILPVYPFYTTANGSDMFRVILQRIINMSLTIKNENLLREEINRFIDGIIAHIREDRLSFLPAFINDFFRGTPYAGSFELHRGEVLAFPIDLESPSPRAFLTFEVGDGRTVSRVPLLQVEGLSADDLNMVLRQRSMSEARNEIERLWDRYYQVHNPPPSSQSLFPPEKRRNTAVQASDSWSPAWDSLQAGRLLSLDELEDMRGARFSDEEFQSFLTLAGYENGGEFFEDILDFSMEMMRRENETVDEANQSTVRAFAAAAPAAARFAQRFIMTLQEHGILALDSMSGDEMSDLIGYTAGSGAITFTTILTFYLIWRMLVLEKNVVLLFPHDVFGIRFDFHSTASDDPALNINSSFLIRLYTPWVENISISEGRTLMLLISRTLFGRTHQAVQNSFGEQAEYWYHGAGTDTNADLFQRVDVSLTGVEVVLPDAPPNIVRPNHPSGDVGPSKRPRRSESDLLDSSPSGGFILPYYPKYVIGNNAFWEWYFLADTQRSKFYEEEKKFAIMMPDKNLEGEELGGCLIRAMKCTCSPGTLFCRCHDDEQFPPIFIKDVAEVCKNIPALVIAINIYPKALRKTKDFRVVMCHPDYHNSVDARVVIINVPNYRSANGHCCLFRPPDLGFLRDDWQRFVDRSFINTFLHKCCRTPYNVCPICGKTYPKDLMKTHYKYHSPGLSCAECGINFSSAEALDLHREYHCRHLGIGANYEFKDEIKGYKDKGTDKPQAIIYADLESAIEEDGTHKTILCGFCERSERKVYIYETIWNLLTFAAKRPEEDVIVYFHNGEGYDFHFVLLELGKMSTDYVKSINVTADSSEKIRYFEVEFKPPQYECKKIKFRDSFAFVQQSLANWVESTKKSGYDFPCFTENFRDARKRALVLQKNPFPYNAIKSAEDLRAPIETMDFWFLQPNNVELFCDKYTSEELEKIYKEWYLPAKTLFKWATVDSYYRTYLKCDVSQLCDVMEHFALQVSNEFSGLNIHDYYGTPSLTWAAWLRQNTFQLDPVKQEDFDIINGSIRGGQTGAMTRYYDCIGRTEDQGSFCCDLDCNSLYATVMLEFEYPCYDWQTVTEYIPLPELELWIAKLHDNNRSGFIECDLMVPDNPELYSYVPVASRRLIKGCYNYYTMNQYCQGSGENPDHLVFSGLCNVVGEHKHYCCHTELMLFYLKHKFVEVTKIYKIIHARTAPVFHDYVKHNLDQRTKYKGDAIKSLLYKLMNNSLYGKTYEDVTKRMDMEVVRRDKMDSVPMDSIKRTILTLDKWTIIEKFKREFIIDKPIYLGACITEFSKLWMYKFFYEDIRPRFRDAQVMYTDTDALTIKFPTGVSSFRELADKLNTPERQIIDTSNWHNWETLPLVHTAANTRPGLFKSETGDARILRMCALRAKTYIMVCDDGSVKMSVKGCPMKEKSRLNLIDFYQVMMGDGTPRTIEYDAIVSKYHIVKSTHLTRVVLSADDRKRFISEDRIHTFPLYSQAHKDALGIYH